MTTRNFNSRQREFHEARLQKQAVFSPQSQWYTNNIRDGIAKRASDSGRYEDGVDDGVTDRLAGCQKAFTRDDLADGVDEWFEYINGYLYGYENAVELHRSGSRKKASRKTAGGAYDWTCGTPGCSAEGVSFVPEDFYEDADLSEQVCPECGNPLIYVGDVTASRKQASRRKTAGYPIPTDQQVGPVTPLDKANEGVTQCGCGCKYFENDRCIDCGSRITSVPGYVQASRRAR